MTRQGEPVEFFLAPPVVDDTGLEVFDVDLPPGSEVYADHSYTHDEIEDLSREDADIYLLTMRKRNSRRPVPPRTIDVQRLYRNLGYVLQELRSAARPTKVRDP
ncbi:MAG: hypothetical protein M5U01_22210 [Ardenticatenaceae bacterium]|nr:hypothetical protein [Ardenticatenaceae bacterium]